VPHGLLSSHCCPCPSSSSSSLWRFLSSPFSSYLFFSLKICAARGRLSRLLFSRTKTLLSRRKSYINTTKPRSQICLIRKFTFLSFPFLVRAPFWFFFLLKMRMCRVGEITWNEGWKENTGREEMLVRGMKNEDCCSLA